MRTSLGDFENELGNGILLLRPLSEEMFERARAAALELDADCLYTFDQQQRKLARTLGLKLN